MSARYPSASGTSSFHRFALSAYILCSAAFHVGIDVGDFIPDDVVLVHHVMVLRETNVGIRLGVPLAGVTSLPRHGIPYLERISAALQILLIQPKYSIHIISHIRSIKPDALDASVEAPWALRSKRFSESTSRGKDINSHITIFKLIQ